MVASGEEGVPLFDTPWWGGPMATEPIRMGYVGCGFMAQHVHLPNFATMPECRLVGLAEMRPRLGALVAARYEIPTLYTSHHELAEDPRVEAVGVSANFAQQGEIAADLLRAGKHVFMEKPMAVSMAQGERILAAARAGKARLMVAYMKRYDPGNVLARATIKQWQDSGEMGAVVYARSHSFCGDWLAGMDPTAMITTDEPVPPAATAELVPSWLPPERVRGYIDYLQNFTHNINLLRYLLGTGNEVGVHSATFSPDGMTGVAVLDLGGVRSVVESADIAFHYYDDHTQVYFEKGWVHVWAPPLFHRAAQSRVEIYEGGERHRYSYPLADPLNAWQYREEAAHFLAALRAGTPFRSSGEDTLPDVQLYEAIYRAHLGLPG
jgi:predicted dehydrogenase